MRNNFILLVLLLIINGFQAISQKANLTGKVLDAENNILAGANIILKNTVRGVQSNAKGEYTISTIIPGKYTIVMTHIGFEKSEIEVQLFPNETKQVDFKAIENF